MGLRSPQQLEQVQVGVPNMPTVEAGKTSTIDLATPAKNFMEQKAIGDQIDSVNKQVRSRKDALIKIKSKYAIESVTGEYKSRMAALVGNNAVTESQGLVDQAARGLEDLKQKAPPALLEQVTRDAEIKLSELQNLMVDKIAVEARKDAINAGNAIVKAFTGEASSKFEDIDAFKEEYNRVYSFARDTEEIKGGGKAQQDLSSAVIASNSVVEGVKFSLAQAATPDKVQSLSDYFEKDILKDPDIHVTEPDITKIRETFNTARLKAEDDLGYHLAAQAQKKMEADPKYTLEQARNDMFEGAKGSVKAATQGYNLLKQIEDSKKAENEKRDREKFGKVQQLTMQGRPAEAEKIAKTMTISGESSARKWLNDTEGGTANAYTDPKDRKFLANLWKTDQEAAAKYPLKNLKLSAKDERAEQARQRVYGRSVQDKNFAIDSGSLESRAESMAVNIAKTKLGLKFQTDPKLAGQVSQNSRDIYFEIRDKYPHEKNEAIIMGHIRDRMNDPEKGLLKDISKPNFLGNIVQSITGEMPSSSWLTKDKVEARPSNEFKSTKQTGGADKIRVPEPTASQVLKFQASIIEDGKPAVSKDKAKAMLKNLWELEANP